MAKAVNDVMPGIATVSSLLAAGRLWRSAVSRQWQYYIWLVVILRLLLPVGPPASLLGKTYRVLDWLPGQAAAQQESAAPPLALAPAEGAA